MEFVAQTGSRLCRGLVIREALELTSASRRNSRETADCQSALRKRRDRQDIRNMKTKIITFTLSLFAGAALLHAEEVATRHSLTMEGAKKAADAAVAFARSNGANPSIAVVDEGGHLLYFVRMDGSFVAGASVSIGKARTSATFKKPTKEFEDIVNKGRFTMTALSDFTPLQGGVPIVHEGRVIGAIGVSGAKSAAQDEEVAKAGAAAIAEKKLATAQ
jgi:uncharacterized protein GlcG (DUF336 family)